MKKALITGITGQDGSYLAELLLEKGYLVSGIVRRTSTFNRNRIEHLRKNPNFKVYYGDLADTGSLRSIITGVMPDEIYNLGAQSHVRISFDVPEYSGDVDGLGVVRILEIIRDIKKNSGQSIKLYQASTSELFGRVAEVPQNEKTPFHPRSPYACAKLYAYWMTRNYREGYDLYVCNGILFNHESPRRGENFVTKKISMGVAAIKKGLTDCIYLGNLDAKRDWGHARDYVEVMYKMMQHETPEDFVIATGETHTIRDFLEEAFKAVNIEIESNGKKGLEEEYIRKDTGKTVVKIDPRFFRPTEVDLLLGDPRKAKEELGWSPRVSFSELVKEMVEYDLRHETYEGE